MEIAIENLKRMPGPKRVTWALGFHGRGDDTAFIQADSFFS